MKTIISTILAAAMTLGTLGTGTMSASAEQIGGHQWYRHGGHHNGHHGKRHYRGGNWDNHRYYRGGHRYYRHYDDNGAAIGAGIAGLAIGAIVGGALADHGHVRRAYPAGGHVARCDAHYRSYDVRTDTFMGYDGRRHRCRL
ncbi:BA14K family protein [Jiella endophytica]|nr:BA14K family protein [Jiella endophytica]